MAKNNSLWFLRALDEDFDLAAGGSLDLRLRSDMQHNSNICLSGSNGRCASQGAFWSHSYSWRCRCSIWSCQSLRDCSARAVLALLGLTDGVLPGEVVLVRSGPGAKV